MRYHIITYGCQMNVHDSERLAGMLNSRGYQSSAEIGDADLIVFNTCCVRDTAETKAVGNIMALKNLKKSKPDLIIAVGGCMAQNSRDALLDKCSHVDIIFGTHNATEFLAYLDRREKERRVCEIWETEGEIVEEAEYARSGSTGAWVNIMYGCDNFCSYCIVPYVRGRERSREPAEIEREVRGLVESGYKQITLLGQNVNSYGKGGDCSFADLLERLVKIEGDFRIRFMTSHPKDISRRLIDVISGEEKVGKFLHLPVQSGSDIVLNAMNRGYNAQSYLDMISYAREKMPNLGLSSDLMVGFPGESEEDFSDTLRLVETVRFDNLYTFIYSPRAGTRAAALPQIDRKIKSERISRLLALQRKISAEKAKESVGKVFTRALMSADCSCAETDCGRAVFLTGGVYTPEFVTVRATSARSGRLYGEIV